MGPHGGGVEGEAAEEPGRLKGRLLQGLEDSCKFTTPMEPDFVFTVVDFKEEPSESMITEIQYQI